ncbi:MAG: hypothetical protein ACRESQ_02230 [Gammaproteobacteria bacterium]
MNGKFKVFLAGPAVLALAACASVPQQYFASSVKAAQAANRPLVVYQFAHTRVAERVPFRSAQKFDAYIRCGYHQFRVSANSEAGLQGGRLPWESTDPEPGWQAGNGRVDCDWAV